MAHYKYDLVTGEPHIRKDLQDIAKARWKASLENLEMLRKNESIGWNRYEKALLTRLIRQKKVNWAVDPYSMNDAQRKASKINWFLHSAMGAQGILQNSKREIVELLHRRISTPPEEAELATMINSADRVLHELKILITDVQRYNEWRRECSKSKKDPQS